MPNSGENLFVDLVKKVQEEQIDFVVVGIPQRVNSHHSSEQLEKTQAFISQLRSILTIPVEVEDESFTTAESIRLQREEKSPAKEDALAAMLIVQAYLNRTMK